MIETKNLYFIDSRRQYRLLESNIEKSKVSRVIQSFLDDHNFKSYYTRIWEIDKGTMYDVGSHTEFFLWGNKLD